MQIDWTTFGLEIANFLVLVWLLKRFLYQPVLATIAERQAGVRQTLAAAKESEERALALQAQYESRLGEWEQEKTAARTQLDAEIAAERERLMKALEKTLADERARQEAIAAQREAARQREREAEALALGRRFVARLLERLADAPLEARLVELFLEELARQPARRAVGGDEAGSWPELATVTSAHRLDEGQRERIAAAVADRLGAASVEFVEDPQLQAGLRVQVGAWQFGLCLADELQGFSDAAVDG